MAGRGRPPVPIEEVRAFGRLVIRERNPTDKLEAVFIRIHRRERRRWGSIRRMYRLWSAFRADQHRPRERKSRYDIFSFDMACSVAPIKWQ